MNSSTLSNQETGDINRLLQLGIQAAKAGRREQARELLLQVVEQDQENIQGWLWLSGVLEDSEERRICLENVLTIDPNNATAQKGLSLLPKRPAASPVPRPAPPVPVEPDLSMLLKSEPPPRTASGSYKRLTPVSPGQKLPAEPPPKSRTRTASGSAKVAQSGASIPAKASPARGKERTASQDIFTDAYQCPYCARQTKPKDERCPVCEKNLWFYLPRKEETSRLYKVILALLGLNLVLSALSIGSSTKEISEVILKDTSTRTLIGLGLIEAITIAYQIVVFIGFYKRWRIVYYLYLFSAILIGVGGVVLAVVMGMTSLVGLCLGSFLFVLAFVQFFLIMGLGEDFTFDKHRILLRIDPAIFTGPDLLSRGGHYSQKKMWALAALYFRQASLQIPGNIKAHLALGFAYFNLKKFDLAEAALAEARRIDPASPLVKELEADLQERRPS
jgi:tetratricopeptide (TPR) repeat protein